MCLGAVTRVHSDTEEHKVGHLRLQQQQLRLRGSTAQAQATSI